MSMLPIDLNVNVLNNYGCQFINVTKFRDVVRPFDTYRNFNVGNPLEANLLVVAELHNNRHCASIISDLINFCADRGPMILMTESLTAGEILDRDSIEEFFRSNGFRLENPQNIHVVGCDIDNELKLTIGTPEHAKIQTQQWLATSLKLKQELAQKFKKIVSIDPCQLIQIVLFAKQMDDLNKDIRNLEKELREMEANPYSEDKEEALFPLRTQAMTSALQQLPQLKEQLGLSPDTLVLKNVGISHAKTVVEDQGNPNYDLTSYYIELEKKHQASILIPKAIAHL